MGPFELIGSRSRGYDSGFLNMTRLYILFALAVLVNYPLQKNNDKYVSDQNVFSHVHRRNSSWFFKLLKCELVAWSSQ